VGIRGAVRDSKRFRRLEELGRGERNRWMANKRVRSTGMHTLSKEIRYKCICKQTLFISHVQTVCTQEVGDILERTHVLNLIFNISVLLQRDFDPHSNNILNQRISRYVSLVILARPSLLPRILGRCMVSSIY